MGNSIFVSIRATLGASVALFALGCGSAAAPVAEESERAEGPDSVGAALVAIDPDADPCALVRCVAGTHCEPDGDGAQCVADVFCGGIAGFACPGAGQCVDDVTDDCDPADGGADCGGMCVCNSLALCIEGSHFDDSPGVCGCVEDYNPCAATTCPVGNDCVVQDGEAQCVEQYNPCAAVLCLQGTQCVVVDDEARCVPQKPHGHHGHHGRGHHRHHGKGRHGHQR